VTLHLFNLSRWALALVIALNFAIPQAYVQGGKAEPLRVQFQRGRSSATIAGKLRGDQQAEYVAGAKKDQKLNINLYAKPPGSITVKVKTQDGADLELETEKKRGLTVSPFFSMNALTNLRFLQAEGRVRLDARNVSEVQTRSSPRLFPVSPSTVRY